MSAARRSTIRLTGQTADATSAKPGAGQAAEQRATVRIEFTQLQDDAGHSTLMSCIVKSIDNARESVDDSGLITGITASETFTARLDQGMAADLKWRNAGQSVVRAEPV